MKYEALRQIFARIGTNLPAPNAAGWSHTACVFAPWKHRGGADRSRGMGVKTEDNGISAFTCKACGSQGRIGDMVRTLAVYRHADYSEVAAEADRFDILGSELPAFDEHYVAEEVLPEPLDESMATGMFERINRYSKAVAFMKRRGIGSATCDKLRIEYDPDKKRIVFPVRDGQNRLFGWSGRTIIEDHKPKVLDYAGLPKRHLILGEERWRPKKPKLIVEGLFAYAHAHEIGAEEHVDIGALLGASLTEWKRDILLNHGCLAYLMTDPDKAGAECIFGKWNDEITAHDGGGALDQLAGEIPIKVPFYPQGVDDFDNITLPDLLRVLETAPQKFPGERS